MRHISVLLGIALLSGCVVEEDPNRIDGSTTLGCEDFRDTMFDLNEGFLTDAELRERIRTNRERRTQYSEQPEVKAAGDELLRAATAGEAQSFIAAVQRMSDACRALEL